MRPGYSIFILSLILLAVIIAGCTDNTKPGNVTPTPAPSVTVTPDVKGTIHSSQVRLVDLRIINPGSDEGPAGNFNITLENVGGSEARNVSVDLLVTDMNTLEQQFDINETLYIPIPAHGTIACTLCPGLYGPDTNNVILNLHIYWGDRQEFWNAYNTTRTLPWSQAGELT
jgi:hypothetical protein